MASFTLLLLFGGILSSLDTVFASSGTCGNDVKAGSTSACDAGNFYQGYCLKHCPIGYYPKDGKCLNCHSLCSSCNENGCLSCVSSNYLSKAGMCAKTCKAKSLMKNSSSPRVRLAEGISSLEGVVEVYYNGSWGTICADEWGMNEAKVLCKELKLGNVIEVNIGGQHRFDRTDGYKNMKIWLSDVSCSGTEKSILECKNQGWDKNQCSHLEDVGVRCSGPVMTRTCESSCGDGYFSSSGKCVECPLDCKTCTSPDICLSCHELKFLEGDSCVEACKPGTFGSSKTRKCEPCPPQCKTCREIGKSPKCTSCPLDKRTNSEYFLNGYECVNKCPSPDVALSKYLRLSGNFSSPYEGLLEVKYGGEWHTVCDDGFYLGTARVFCRELGYGQPIHYGGGRNGRGSGKILAQEVRCTGNERSFTECPQTDWFSPGCSHYEDVGLSCQPPPSGYVVPDKCIEACPDGTFKDKTDVCELCDYKCSTCIDNPKKCLSCRKPYFHNGTGCALTCPDGKYPNTTLRHCLDCSEECMTCSDRADRCLSCRQPLLLNATRCLTKCPGKMHRKEHSCVADCGLRHYAENGVCHACPLNCLVCTSSASCRACEHAFVLNKTGKCERNCAANQYWAPVLPKSVGIDLPLRLTSVGGSQYKGRLEIKHGGVWGSICDDGWSVKNAQVACRQLLLGPPVLYLYLRHQSFKEMNISRIWLDDVDCKGTEESLADCTHRNWGDMNCVHAEDVHIECSSPGISSCEDECPPAYYKNATMCTRCSVNCLNCTGVASNCSLCEKGYYRTNDSICRVDCPPGFYKATDRKCKPCHSSCWTCNGSGDSDCTSCRRPTVFHAKKCLDKCPKDTYQKGLNPYVELWKKTAPYQGIVLVSIKGQEGFICDRYVRIETAHVVCKELQMGTAVRVFQGSVYYAYSRPMLLKNPVCVGNESSIFDCKRRTRYTYCSRRNIMSVQCSGPDTSSYCVANCATDLNYYLTEDKKTCGLCSTSCLRCEKNATTCTACREGLVLTLENKCVQYCREGTFFNAATKKCEECDLGKCDACYANKGVCTKCADGKYLNDGNCLEYCGGVGNARNGSGKLRLHRPVTSSWIPSRGVVETYYKGHWLDICAAAWNIQSAAVVCRQLGYGNPVEFFHIPKYMLDVASQETLVTNCTGKEKTLEECVRIGPCPTYRLAAVQCERSTPRKECVISCGVGFYPKKTKLETKCEPCSINCTTCVGSADTCTACGGNSALHGSKCVEVCPHGYFIHLGRFTCERCSEKCRTCFDGVTNDNCSSCNKPYFLNDTKCVESCYPDYTLEDLMGTKNPSENIRIINGSNAREGFVKVKRDKDWGLICYANQFIVTLICHEFGFQSGRFLRYEDGFASLQSWSVSCAGHEASLEDCSIRPGYCRRKPVISCDNTPLDKRMCRKENKVSCSRAVCSDRTSCNAGDGKVIPKEHSYCSHCPVNFYGDGIICRGIAKVPPAVRYPYMERKLLVRRRYYMPCFGRAGRSYVRANRNSWFKDGKRLKLDTGRFVLGPIHYRHAGIYKCVLENSAGSATITYNVTIVGQPTIERADNVNIVHGASAMLNCEVFARPPATISWRLGNVTFNENTTRNSVYRLMSNGSLYIQKPGYKHDGIYECSASNAYGTSTIRVALRIGEEISFERRAGSLTVAKGDTAKFKCRPLHATDNMSIKWRRKGKTLKKDKKYDIDYETLTIKNVAQEDCGEYYCVVRDGPSIVTSTGTLAIKDGSPCIHTPPQNVKVEVGMYARFYCAATGDPGPTILWQNKKQRDVNVFEIKEVNVSHVGVYVCTARSKEKDENAYAFLTVADQYPCPYIFQKPTDKTVNYGESATFNCDGVAVNLRQIKWSKGNSYITNNAKHNLENGNRKLTINNVNKDDIGVYKCEVAGVHGTSSVTALLRSSSNARAVSGGGGSTNTAGIVIGVLVCILVILIVLYFVHRYRHHGATPVDVIKDVKRKTFSRFQSPQRHTVLQYDASECNDYNDDDAYDTSDTNPFVRD